MQGVDFKKLGVKKVHYILFIDVVPKGNAMFQIIDTSWTTAVECTVCTSQNIKLQLGVSDHLFNADERIFILK